MVPVVLMTLRAAMRQRCQRLLFLRSSCLGSVSNDGFLRDDTWGLCVLSISFFLQPHSHLVQPWHL